ncbi:hypothetical protein Tco_0896714 [Tanacetum coccineum]
MRNGAMSELHLARFNAVREFDDHRINCELDGVDVSNMMSRRDFVHFLNKATEDIVHKLPKILEERLEMMKNNNKEQSSENINNKKRKWNKKRKTNEVDSDVSAADLYPGDGSDYECKALDLNDPEVKADIDEKRRKVALLIKQFEKEEDEADEEEMKKMKEKKKMKEEQKKKKMMMKKKKKNKRKKMEIKRSGRSHSSGSNRSSGISRSSGSSRCSMLGF